MKIPKPLAYLMVFGSLLFNGCKIDKSGDVKPQTMNPPPSARQTQHNIHVNSIKDTSTHIYDAQNLEYHRKNYSDTIPDFSTENMPPVAGGPFFHFGRADSRDKVILNNGQEFLAVNRDIVYHSDSQNYDVYSFQDNDQVKMLTDSGQRVEVIFYKKNAQINVHPTLEMLWENQDKAYDATEASNIAAAVIRNANKMPAKRTPPGG